MPATIAQEERRLISERTKAALSAPKRRGVKLGSARPGHWAGREGRRRKGVLAASAAAAAKRAAVAVDVLAEARPVIKSMPGASLRKIAAALQAAGVLTATGRSRWTATGVARLLKRL